MMSPCSVCFLASAIYISLHFIVAFCCYHMLHTFRFRTQVHLGVFFFFLLV